MTERRAFFVPHPLKPSNEYPGRVPFRVDAHLLTTSGLVARRPVIVCADGYGNRTLAAGEQNTVGSNQDPCVFAHPLPIIHSFCRIDGLPQDAVRRGLDTLTALSVEVCPGDLILYGKYSPATRKGVEEIGVEEVWIDTVIVVERRVVWPSTPLGGNSWRLHDPAAFAAQHLGVQYPSTADVYNYNLSAALPSSCHATTGLQPHRVIIGKISLDGKDLSALETSFIPLAQRRGSEWFPPRLSLPDDLNMLISSRRCWRDLADFVRLMAQEPRNSGYIQEFDDLELALDVCDNVLAISGGDQGLLGTVAIPPLSPTPAPQRRGGHRGH